MVTPSLIVGHTTIDRPHLAGVVSTWMVDDAVAVIIGGGIAALPEHAWSTAFLVLRALGSSSFDALRTVLAAARPTTRPSLAAV